MKRLVSILIALLTFSAISQAQRTGTSEVVGSIIGYGVKLTDSPFGEGGDTHLLTIGISF